MASICTCIRGLLAASNELPHQLWQQQQQQQRCTRLHAVAAFGSVHPQFDTMTALMPEAGMYSLDSRRISGSMASVRPCVCCATPLRAPQQQRLQGRLLRPAQTSIPACSHVLDHSTSYCGRRRLVIAAGGPAGGMGGHGGGRGEPVRCCRLCTWEIALQMSNLCDWL